MTDEHEPPSSEDAPDTPPRSDDDARSSELHSDEELPFKERLGILMARAFKLLPYLSLCTGLGGALLMDRSANAAALVIGAATLGWLAVLGFGALQRIDADRLQGKKALLVKVGEFSTIIIMQTLMQQCFFFAIPFYALSASFVGGHLTFLTMLVACAVVTLWDPLFEAAMKIAGVRFSMQFLAAFVSFNAMLPALGLTNTWSLFVSSAVAALGIPLQGWVFRETSRRELVAATGISVLGIPLLLIFGAGASIPPAPLMLSKGAMGTSYSNYQVTDPLDSYRGVPPALVCGTDIRGPRGLREELFHVWRHPDGHQTDRIALRISGGRKEGFRTYSKKSKLGKNPWGTWSCSVVTSVGQLVGRRSIELVKPGAE